MESLYQISDKLLSIFGEIESADGEVTEEQLENLQIAKDELDTKFNNYVKAIRCWESDINACKEEEKRIKANRNIKENRIERLKNYMLDAVMKFGVQGKTNKYYELPDSRIYTRDSQEVAYDDLRINRLIKILIDIISSGTITNIDTEDDYVELLNEVNRLQEIYYPDDEKYILNDIKYLRMQYTDAIDIKSLINGYTSVMKFNQKRYGFDVPLENITNLPQKTIIKMLFKNGEKFTICDINNNTSLCIK